MRSPHLPLLALLTSAVSAAPTTLPPRPGTVLEIRPLGRLEAAQVRPAIARLYARAGVPETPLAVDRFKIRLATLGLDGKPSSVAATLDVPVKPNLERDRPPVFVFGPGTSGVADSCAPSREQPLTRTWGNYSANSLSYASAGFVTITPDYLYFDDPTRFQPYFVAKAEAQVMLDAARAVLDAALKGKIRANPAPAVFLGGYSQGGHAAFAAADALARIAPELPLKGVLGFAPTTSVAGLMQQSPQYAPYIVTSYRQTYGPSVNPADILAPKAVRTLERDMETLCVDGLGVYPQNPLTAYTPGFARALFDPNFAGMNPTFARALRENEAGLSSAARRIPAFIAQGGTDPIVVNRQQRSFFGKLCALGRPTVYRQYPSVHHFQARQFAFRDAVAWMEALSSGKAPVSDCKR